MAFKNILTPNQASSGDVLNNTVGLDKWSTNNQATISRDTNNKVSGTGSTKVTSNYNGTQLVSAYIAASSYKVVVTGGLVYALSSNVKVNSNTATNGYLRIDWRNSGGSNISYSPFNISTIPSAWTSYSVVATAPANAVSAYLLFSFFNLSLNDVIYFDQNQFEQGSSVTPWEFPGLWELGGIPSQQSVNNVALKPNLKPNSVFSSESIQNLFLQSKLNNSSVLSSEFVNDLLLKSNINPNSIPSVETVSDIVLNNILMPLGIVTEEIINNLTLTNTLELLGIISEELVGNAKFIQNLILEAIETQETVNDIILYFYYEFMQLLISVRSPSSEIQTMTPSLDIVTRTPSSNIEVKKW